jgi:hypothetical protein
VKGNWADSHFDQIRQAYGGAAQAKSYMPRLQAVFEAAKCMRRLTEINEVFLRHVFAELAIPVAVTRDSAYTPTGARSERVLSTCLAADATHYLSGPSAKAYLDEAMFAEAGITVEWMQYGPYPDYPQLHGPFEGQVSVIDLLLNGGSDALSRRNHSDQAQV